MALSRLIQSSSVRPTGVCDEPPRIPWEEVSRNCLRGTFFLPLWSNYRRDSVLSGATMPFFKSVVIVAMIILFESVVFAAPGAVSPAPPILPKQFAGWQMQGVAQPSKDAAAADPTNAALLKEYGFTDFEAAAYKSDDGRTLKIRAARFADASGAFGAYTFYLQPAMSREEIGDQGASAVRRVLFYSGHIVVDARVQWVVRIVIAAGLRELAGALPRPGGNATTACRRFLPSCRTAATERTRKSMPRGRWVWARSRLRCLPNSWISARTPK